jgi:sugar phosphate isomerase/epimerase
MRSLGIDMQTVFGLSPLDHIEWASELGCQHVTFGLSPVPRKLPDIAPWSLVDDLQLRCGTRASLRETGISLEVVEGFALRPQANSQDRAAELDIAAELGAKRITAVVMEPDRSRALDQLSILADLASQRGMQLLLEFAPPHAVNTLAGALATIREVNRPNFRLVIDAMHFFRTKGTVEDLLSVEPALISYVQLCDAPRSSDEDYLQEACFRRKAPGDGELPLVDLMRAIPAGVPIGLEVPIRAEAEKDLKLTIARIVSTGRRVLDQSESP